MTDFSKMILAPLAAVLVCLAGVSATWAQSDEAASSEAEEAAQAFDPMRVRLGLMLSPRAFRAAAAKVQPSIVTIETFGGALGAKDTAKAKRRPNLPIPVPGRKKPKKPQFKVGEGPTTGLIVSEQGYIVTSTFAFVKRPPIITVTLADGSQRVAKLLGRDLTRKVCLLKIEPDGAELKVPELLDREQLRVGQWAMSVGVGYGGDEPAVSAGIISATERAGGRAVQTDANINPGNYGGPLIDIDGRVIGVCVPLSPRGNGATAGVEWYDSGIGFAIPLHDILDAKDRLKDPDTVIEPGKMGIQPGGSKKGGVLVRRVAKGSPAERVGLKPGDIIRAVDRQQVKDVTDLMRVMGRHRAGDEVEIAYMRDGDGEVVKLTLGSGGWSFGKPDKKKKSDKKDEPAEPDDTPDAAGEAADAEPDAAAGEADAAGEEAESSDDAEPAEPGMSPVEDDA